MHGRDASERASTNAELPVSRQRCSIFWARRFMEVVFLQRGASPAWNHDVRSVWRRCDLLMFADMRRTCATSIAHVQSWTSLCRAVADANYVVFKEFRRSTSECTMCPLTRVRKQTKHGPRFAGFNLCRLVQYILDKPHCCSRSLPSSTAKAQRCSYG